MNKIKCLLQSKKMDRVPHLYILSATVLADNYEITLPSPNAFNKYVVEYLTTVYLARAHDEIINELNEKFRDLID